jgi:hypothetical protein
MGLSRRRGGWNKEVSIGKAARALDVNANVLTPLAAGVSQA